MKNSARHALQLHLCTYVLRTTCVCVRACVIQVDRRTWTGVTKKVECVVVAEKAISQIEKSLNHCIILMSRAFSFFR